MSINAFIYLQIFQWIMHFTTEQRALKPSLNSLLLYLFRSKVTHVFLCFHGGSAVGALSVRLPYQLMEGEGNERWPRFPTESTGKVRLSEMMLAVVHKSMYVIIWFPTYL
jgi:hypothetical protein